MKKFNSAALKSVRCSLKDRDLQWAGKNMTCLLITTYSAFNQSIQLDSIKTGKPTLSEFPVPCWKCQLIPIGNRNQYHVLAIIQSRAVCQLFLSTDLSTSNLCAAQGGTPNEIPQTSLTLFPMSPGVLLPVTAHSAASGRQEHFQGVQWIWHQTLLRISLPFFLKHFWWQKSNNLPPTPSAFVFYCKYKWQKYQEGVRWSERARTS